MTVETYDGERFEVERSYIDLSLPLIRFKLFDGTYIFLNPREIKQIIIWPEEQKDIMKE